MDSILFTYFLNDRAHRQETEKLDLAPIKLFTKYVIFPKFLHFSMPLLPLLKDEDLATPLSDSQDQGYYIRRNI